MDLTFDEMYAVCREGVRKAVTEPRWFYCQAGSGCAMILPPDYPSRFCAPCLERWPDLDKRRPTR